MLTGQFHHVPTDSIIVSPGRQRQDFRGVDELADSIAQAGLINPIVLTPDNVLVAGERRLRACIMLGFTHIPAQYTNELTAEDAELIELEENVKREDLTWQETVRSVARLYALKAKSDDSWTLEKASVYMSVSPTTIHNHLLVARYLDAEDELVSNADHYSTALNAAKRKEERSVAAADEEASASIDETLDSALSFGDMSQPRGTIAKQKAAGDTTEIEMDGDEPASDALGVVPLRNLDFAEWANSPPPGRKINFLHCDFPYGINYDKHKGGAGQSMGAYNDSPEAFEHCMSALEAAMPSHIAKSAHLMFWFSGRLDLLHPVYLRLEALGWKVNPVPLIWFRSCNAGILPDPSRGPRQVYEVALMASRGDRKIVQPVANLYSHAKTKEVHPSEKPRDMLSHFFRMFVDSTTVMLDPTCGSGNSVISAELAGAKSVLGLEADPEHYKSAVSHYKRVVFGD